MKTFIALTDFSASADNAVRYAAHLAHCLHAALRIVHVYQVPISMSEVPVLLVSTEELRNNADKGLEAVKDSVQSSFPALQVETESHLGDVVEEVNRLCRSAGPTVLVVGKHGASGVERLLFGSTTLSLLRHAHCPVISVPQNFSTFHLKHIAMAIDVQGLHGAEHKVAEFAKAINSRLHVIHVKESGRDTPELPESLRAANPVFRLLDSDDFLEGVKKYVEHNHIDLLVTQPHKHNLLDRLFSRQHTSEVLNQLQVPVMCIPD